MPTSNSRAIALVALAVIAIFYVAVLPSFKTHKAVSKPVPVKTQSK